MIIDMPGAKQNYNTKLKSRDIFYNLKNSKPTTLSFLVEK